MKKILNWVCGSMFRTFGRIIAFIVIGGLFAYLLSNDIIRLPQLFGIMKVNASVSNVMYDLDNNPNYFEFAVLGNSQSTETQACYYGTNVDFTTTDTLLNTNTYVNDGGFLKITGQKGGFDTNDIFQGNGNNLQNVFRRLEFKVQGSVDREFTGNSSYGTNYTFAFKVATYQKNFFFDNDWSYNTMPQIVGSNNLFYIQPSGWNYAPFPFSFDINSGILYDRIDDENTNVAWIYFTIKNYYNVNGFIFDMWVPSDKYYYCSDDSGYWFGQNHWFYILDAKVFDYNFSINDLTFDDVSYSNNNFYVPSGFDDPNSSGGSNEPGFEEIIIDDDVQESIDNLNNFFTGFSPSTHGLASIITAPLTAIQSLTSQTCSPLVLPLPYLDNKTLTLPCMRSIYVSHFGSFMTLYDTITFGIVSYWIIVRLLRLVKDFKNPDHDEIEVVDL